MVQNPLLGVVFHWLGGLFSASFYVPYKQIKFWSWEVFWLTGGIFSWLVCPWFFASIQTEDLMGVLSQTSISTLQQCYLWGVGWGFGGLTFGLAVRYMGISSGMAIVLGLTTVIGTLGPPILGGTIGEVLTTISGQIAFVGVFMTLGGVVLVSKATAEKNKSQPATAKNDNIDIKKGIGIALFSGVMSSCFAFGIASGKPIRELTLQAGTDHLWQGLPVLCVVLAGGLTTNLIWCLYLIIKNRSGREFIGRVDGGKSTLASKTMLRNYLLAAFGGALWYFQFFMYTMGESHMGKYEFSSWTLHMASIIIFSTIWGIALLEWKGSSSKSRILLFSGISVLVLSTVAIGIGNALQ
ncbi:L-rhamnose/proton symporter RhaT [Aliiglaciecola sp. LCG003]|uniref:L-rhamnose/proton symporter RhaT n=1 Tax=Aliiglaciecola sp. LCG003 TaxID=3053655 RepID=UPI002572A5CF|nr:L-rhamnose/proton symporter RhaT [Aliiglaciecola sp. LCG003]WJG09687.1 L-rhamnose/proton symporter RhaT [Aliiglaciecola sp. LCG003]